MTHEELDMRKVAESLEKIAAQLQAQNRYLDEIVGKLGDIARGVSRPPGT